jgi:hypothetical protein
MDQNAEDDRIRAKLRASIDRSLSDEGIQDEYRKRFRRQMAVIPAAFASAILVAAEPEGLLFVFALTCLGALLAFTLWNWRCPACNGWFGRAWNPRFCAVCGVELRGRSGRTPRDPDASTEKEAQSTGLKRYAPVLTFLAGGGLCFFLCCGGGLYFFFGSLADDARQNLENDPRFSAHIGQVQECTYNFSASLGAGEKCDVFDVKGTKWSGRVTVKNNDNRNGILWARFTLPSGEVVEINNNEPAPGDDAEPGGRTDKSADPLPD